MRSQFAAGVLVAIVAGCGGPHGGDSREPLALYPWKSGDATMDALIGGVLERDGRCLYIATASGDRVFVAFPETRATWDEREAALFFDGRRVNDGEPTTLSGGFTRERNFAGWPSPPAEGCDLSNVWLAGGLGPVVE